MEDMQDIIVLVTVILVGTAIGNRVRKKRAKKLKARLKIVAICPKCHAEIGLEKVRNYICSNCHTGIGFYNFQTGEIHEEAETFHCGNCDSTNFKGIKYCTSCGTEFKN